MIIVLTGAPGAGKGTQAALLEERCGYRKISTGDALRRQVKLATPIGKQAEAIMAAGKLVSDEVLFEVLKEELGRDPKEIVLLDGYPRNKVQAQTLETLKSLHPVKAAIQIEVPRMDLINRLSGRLVCPNCAATFHKLTSPPRAIGICNGCGSALSQRPDDAPEKVAVRLDVYDQNTKPVLDFYRQKGLLREIRGTGDTETVYGEVNAAIAAAL